MRPSLLPVAAAAALLLGGCAHVGGFTCPSKGGAAWHELRTAHFVVSTDVPEDEAEGIARDVEAVWGTVVWALFQNPPPLPGGVRVIAFRSMEEFREFSPPNAEAYYAIHGSGAMIVLPGVLDERQRAALAHELTHHVTCSIFARQPRWFAEGLATFMESVGGDGSWPSHPAVGGVPRRYAALLAAQGALRLDAHLSRDLLLPGVRVAGPLDYAAAWLLVHFLVNTEPAGFADLQRRFQRGEPPARAWTAVFPRWDPETKAGRDALDAALRAYLANGQWTWVEIALPEVPPAAVRVLTSAEVHELRLLVPRRGERDEVARAIRPEVEEALSEDPGSVVALRWAAALDRLDPVPLARKAVAAHPDQARAWLFLGQALPRDDLAAREEAFRRAVAADPSDAEALNSLAWHLLGGGRSGEALPLARRAVAAAPWSAMILDTLGGVLADLGQCAEALATQRRALDAAPEGADEHLRESVARHLEEMERQCDGSSAR